MNDTPTTEVTPQTAFRVARAFLDGAPREWIAKRFSLTPDDVETAWRYAKAAVRKHYQQSDITIDDFESFAADNIEDVLNLLVTWTDSLSLPTVEPPPESSDDTGEKKGTGQGETGG